MALASNQQDIAGANAGQRCGNGFVATGDFNGCRTGGDDGGTDAGRILGARVIIGHKHLIGTGAGDVSHFGTFSGIAVAATAEQNDKLAGCSRLQRRQRRRQRIRRMCVIDNNLCLFRVTMHHLHASRHRCEIGQRSQRVMQWQAAHMAHDRRC